ncbi:MAG: hypothetical protein KDE24_16995, partial [Caldilinea sp.]|nr:hypothetical protein [Caldilinea sp.]
MPRTLRKSLLVFGLPTLLLSLLFCVFQWLIPRNAGLGAAFLLLYLYLPLIIGVGVVTTIIIFAHRLIPRHEGLILLGILLWCVVPIFGGFLLYAGVLVGLHSFYHSDWFIERRLDRLELSITPVEQRYEYACGHTYFVATYCIASRQETPLLFALANADREYGWFHDYGTEALATASLGEQFAAMDDGERYYSPRTDLGTFVMPPGDHTITVKGNVPFSLAVYHPESLWTPGLFLHDERDYPELYIGEYLTQAELDRLPTAMRSPICTAAELPAPAPPHVEAPAPAPPTYYLDDRIYIPTITGQEDYLISYTNHDVSFTPPREDGPGPRTVTYADNAKTVPIIDGAIYKTVINTVTGQAVNIYVTVRKKDDPQTPFIPYDEFVAALRDKPALTADDARYLQRTDGFFWVDRGLRFEGFAVRFHDHITPYDHEGAVERLVEVIETMAPAAEFRQ